MKKFSGLLLLEDGTSWDAEGFGKQGFGVGELCFNTSMTGYQEIISDPSYTEQIITFTFPHIGNVGTNKDDNESVLSSESDSDGSVIEMEEIVTKKKYGCRSLGINDKMEI